MRKPVQAFMLAIILVVAIVLDAVVLHFVADPVTRLTFGLLVLVPIVWAGSRLGVVELAWDLMHPPRYPRRFVRLRARVEELLGEIRRLNGIAVDAARGVREQHAALAIMDGIEERLRELIGEIRSAAGVEAEADQNHRRLPSPTVEPGPTSTRGELSDTRA